MADKVIIPELRTMGKIFIVLGLSKLIYSIGYLLTVRDQRRYFSQVDYDPEVFDNTMIEPLITGLWHILFTKIILTTLVFMVLLILIIQLSRIYKKIELGYELHKPWKYLIYAMVLTGLVLFLELIVTLHYFNQLQQLRNLSGDSYIIFFIEINQSKIKSIFYIGLLNFVSTCIYLVGYIFIQDLLFAISRKYRFRELSHANKKFDYVKAGAGFQVFVSLIEIIPFDIISVEIFLAYLYLISTLFMSYGLISSGDIFSKPSTYSKKIPKYGIGPTTITAR